MRDQLHPFVRSGHGMRGGVGPNAGKTSAKFKVVFPDGTAAVKRVFNCDLVDAEASVYNQFGEWRIQSIFARGVTPAQVKDVFAQASGRDPGLHVTSRAIVAAERIG